MGGSNLDGIPGSDLSGNQHLVPEDALPNTCVPGRNLLFCTYAAALAYRRDLKHAVGGMCEANYSGYPDVATTRLTRRSLR